MKLYLAAAAAIWMSTGTSVSAAGLCDCCESGLSQSCIAACDASKPEIGQCLIAVDYTAATEIGPGQNPLYGRSLRTISLGTPNRDEREAFRRLMEKSRLGVENDRKLALRAHAKGEIDDTEAQRLAKRYDDAIVNYYLGIHAYRVTK